MNTDGPDPYAIIALTWQGHEELDRMRQECSLA